jgi:hypothetical protein
MIEVNKVRSLFTELKPYDVFATGDDYISITEWHNGEGFDVDLHSHTTKQLFQLSWGEFDALTTLVNYKEG